MSNTNDLTGDELGQAIYEGRELLIRIQGLGISNSSERRVDPLSFGRKDMRWAVGCLLRSVSNTRKPMICLLGRLKSRIPSITIDRFCADQLANAVLTLPEAELATLFQVLRLFVQETTFTESEWPLVSAILPPESLAKMARVNYQNLESSLRSAEVRSRIHCLALICCYLSGSYSKTGIAKWFQRKRPKLGDKTPEELLSLEYYAWLKESAKVRDLALGLNQ